VNTLSQLFIGGLVSVFNFGVHAVMTVLIVVVVGRTAKGTSHLHVYRRVTILMAVAVLVLMATHVFEIAIWAGVYELIDLKTPSAGSFEFAFENYTALGYGDAVPGKTQRLIGPITALNGLLLVGWSVAVIFEVLRMAEVRFEQPLVRKSARKSGAKRRR
jgi:hypothetical protein